MIRPFFMLIILLVSLCVLVRGADLDPATFEATVVNDSRVWMVEFYSAMCGGCQEFASTWDRIAEAFSESSHGGAIATGKINIDNKAGLKIAEELGVLEDGVPHVRLFKRKGDKKGMIMVKSDSSLEYVKITNRVVKATSGLHKKDHYYQKE